VNRGFALTIGILAMLAPAIGRAQTNLDRGKSASQLFAGSCVECHKSPQALAKGKNAATVAEFLREHYTTGRDQAAALAAYVVSGHDTVASPVPGRRPAAGGVATQRPPSASDATANANPKPHRPSEETTTSGGSMINPIVRSEPAVQSKPQPATATRTRRKEPGAAEAPQEPAATAHVPGEGTPEAARQEPAAQEPPTSAMTPTAAAPAPAEPMPTEAPATESGETGARDNIPD
jgi:hypothetical protein